MCLHSGHSAMIFVNRVLQDFLVSARYCLTSAEVSEHSHILWRD